MKKTPWFPNSIKPVRVGVYEIKGSRFSKKDGLNRFRRWDGSFWSFTYIHPNIACQEDLNSVYRHGEDMTGWRGIKK